MASTFMPFLDGQYGMEREAVSSRVVRFFETPGLTSFAQNFDEGFKVILLVGFRQHLVGIRDDDEVAFGRHPVEVGETFFQGIPVVAKVVGKREDPAEFIQKPGFGFTFFPGDGFSHKVSGD